MVFVLAHTFAWEKAESIARLIANCFGGYPGNDDEERPPVRY